MLAAARRCQSHRRLAAAMSAGREAPDAHPGEAGAQPSTAGATCTAPEQHWLDKRLPGAREWLEAKSRAWWLKGVELRCRQHASLGGRDDLVREGVERRFQALMRAHQHRVTDSRSQTHLQVACLTVATYNTLLPLLRDRQVVLDMLREHQGSSAAPWLRWPLRFGLLLSRDPFAATARRLRWLGLDMGRSFACSFSEEAGHAEMQVQHCLYQALFESEGVSLAECCCCSQDSVWFEGLESHGVGFERTAWLAAGDSCCKLAVHRLPKT